MIVDACIPIAVGVTGHRDLIPDDIPALEATVREYFQKLRDKCRSTPLLLISPLAEGADRLVARVALDFGAKLIVPLPFDQAEYEADFGDESRQEFREFLSRAHRVFEVGRAPSVAGTVDLASVVRADRRSRALQYEAAGVWVALNCQVLIVLWDGIVTHKIGGTSTVVETKLGNSPGPAMRRPLDDLHGPESGPVFKIRTRRRTQVPPPTMAVPAETLYPGAWGPEESACDVWNETLKRIEEYNSKLAGPDKNLAREMARPDSWAPAVDGETDELARYVAADAMARRYQRSRRRALHAVFAITLFAIAALIAYDDLFGARPWAQALAATYVVLFGAACGVFYFSRRRALEDRHLAYRALAESLRVQMHWDAAGVGECVADYYLRKQRTDLDWIRAALRNCTNLRGPRSAPAGRVQQDLEGVRREWLAKQVVYYRSRLQADRQRGSAIRRFATVAACAAAAIGICLAIAHPVVLRHQPSQGIMLAAMSALLSAAGAAKAYALTMAFDEEAKQYQRMHQYFSRADRVVSAALADGDMVRARQMIFEVGSEALRESGDWLMLHRARPMEAPTH